VLYLAAVARRRSRACDVIDARRSRRGAGLRILYVRSAVAGCGAVGLRCCACAAVASV